MSSSTDSIQTDGSLAVTVVAIAAQQDRARIRRAIVIVDLIIISTLCDVHLVHPPPHLSFEVILRWSSKYVEGNDFYMEENPSPAVLPLVRFLSASFLVPVLEIDWSELCGGFPSTSKSSKVCRIGKE
jgi:hypothetical protein